MTSFQSSVRAVVCAAAAVVAAACGSDSGSGGHINSGVNESEPVNMVSPSDAQKVCSAVASYAASRISPDVVRKSVCVALAAVQPDGMPPTVDDCNMSVEQCMKNQSTTTPDTPGTPMCVAGATITTCMASVGELQTCTAALIDQAASNVEAVNCDLYGLPPAEASMRLQPNTSIPPACDTVRQKCPGFVPEPQPAGSTGT